MNASLNSNNPTLTPEAQDERSPITPEAQPTTTNELSEQELRRVAGGRPIGFAGGQF
jgi:hypothetical protein